MLADELVRVLAKPGGMTAAELAVAVAVDEEAVVVTLHAAHDRFRCDRGSPSRWWLAAGPVRGTARTGREPGRQPAKLVGLHAWQADALAAWAAQGHRGVVEAVTGAGKTMVGIAAALEELGRRGQVVVLVPTAELQRQWVAELSCRLPDGARVGQLGAGSGDRLASCDVLVAVVNSARAGDLRPVRRGGLLVADECHRYGSTVNQMALDRRFSRRLGLSATYARDDGGSRTFLDPYFGGVCFRLGYARAVADGVTARFSATLVGVRFSDEEQAGYDDLTAAMAKARARLLAQHGVVPEPFEAFLRAVVALADGNGPGSRLARTYRQAMLERRRLLADTPAKEAALVRLAPAVEAADRALVFTRSIAGSERAAALLAVCGLRSGVVHSAQPAGERRAALQQFAAGALDVLAAPRVLDEGVDVPAADLAVIVGASRSRRQMVQRMGRVLRRKPDGRTARFAVLFVEGTVEDPRRGAHEAFLGEILDVAEATTCFPATLAQATQAVVLASLRPDQ